jgi:hypothetical protein
MELYVPNAIHAQLLSLPDAERTDLLSKLEQFAAHPD